MMNRPKKKPAKQEYSKSGLKQRIDAAMQAFLEAGGKVQGRGLETLSYGAEAQQTEPKGRG